MYTTVEQRMGLMSRHPVGSFISLTFIISYVLGIPFNALISPFVKDTNEVFGVLLPRLVTVYGPAIAAVIVTLGTSGRSSVRVMLRKLVPEARHVWWSLVIPLVCVFISFISFAIAGASIAQLFEFLLTDWHWLIVQLVGQFLIVGIGEELGWRGWLLPTLARRHSLMVCVLWIFVIWGLWHLPVLFKGYRIVVPWLMMLGSMTFLTAWMWLKVNGNIFILASMHASFNASEVFFENRLNESNGSKELILTGWAILACVYVLIAIVVFICSDKIVWRTRFPRTNNKL